MMTGDFESLFGLRPKVFIPHAWQSQVAFRRSASRTPCLQRGLGKTGGLSRRSL